jgi:DNA replication protein DnaC
MPEVKNTGKLEFCSFCEHRGIIRNPESYMLGHDPMTPCPECVQKVCKCNGEEPYYFNDNGFMKECRCRPVRLRIDRIHQIYKTSGIEKKYLWRFINEFNCKSEHDKQAKNIAYDIIQKYPKVDKGLFLWGNPGTGKTFLSTIIMTEIISRHAIEGRFVKISRGLFSRLKDTFNPGSDTYGTALKIETDLAEIPILVIDDFGIQRDSAWEQETLYNLIDSRYEKERFTLFTSNLDPNKSMKELSNGRILSRIKEMSRIIELSGSDRRENL